MAQDYTPPPPIETFPPMVQIPAPKKNNTTMWIIIAVVAVLLCCCCSVVAILYFFGDQIRQALGVSIPLLRSLI
jgi:hypothetical protein